VSYKNVKRAVQKAGQPSGYGLIIIIEPFGRVTSVDKSEPLLICKSTLTQIVIDDRMTPGSS
jgi:hypothetical protein